MVSINWFQMLFSHQIVSDSLGSHELQASLSFTISWNLLKPMSIESGMPSNHLVLLPSRHPCFLLPSLFPSIRVFFPKSGLFTSGGQSIAASALASVLPMNIQSWFPLSLTDFISLLSKGLLSLLHHHYSKASILWHSAFFMVQLSCPYITIRKTIALTR